MYCPNCGNKVEEDARFCSECGTPLEKYRRGADKRGYEESPEEILEKRAVMKKNAAVKKKQRWILTGAGILSVTVGVGAGVMLFNSGSRDIIGNFVAEKMMADAGNEKETLTAESEKAEIEKEAEAKAGQKENETKEPNTEPTAAPTTEPTVTPTAEPTATPTPEPTATPTPEPLSAALRRETPDVEGEGLRRVNVASASATSEIHQANGTNNSPMMMFDRIDESSWQEGVDGFGIGTEINVNFEEKYGVKYMAFKLGNWKNDKYYYGNAKPKTMTFKLGDFSGQVTFTGERREEWIEFSRPIDTDTLTMVLDEVYAGTSWEDTCIAEIAIYGE